MLILRANPKGGRPIKPGHFPLHTDENGDFGYLLGYDEKGRKWILPIALAEQVANVLGNRTNAFKSALGSIKPKLPFKEWLFLKLFGRKTYSDLKEMYEDEIK